MALRLSGSAVLCNLSRYRDQLIVFVPNFPILLQKTAGNETRPKNAF
jgi:hypothetical protein